MPLKDYGVLVGRPVSRKQERDDDDSPHYQLFLQAQGMRFRNAINVKSQQSPSQLLFLAVQQFRHPVTNILNGMRDGFHSLKDAQIIPALDFIRGNLFDPCQMIKVSDDLAGPGNDLNDHLDSVFLPAIRHGQSRVYVFGEPFNNGRGMHDVHMNQGNSEGWVKDDGVWQDGAVLVHFLDERRWAGVFLAFQSQAWHTDDYEGHALPDTSPGLPCEEDGPGTPLRRPPESAGLYIVGAQVNPLGHDAGRETVLLLNSTPDPVDLDGWVLLDHANQAHRLVGLVAPPGRVEVVALPGDTARLSNKGGTITLLNPQGLKVHGVSYTEAQAKKKGWTLKF